VTIVTGAGVALISGNAIDQAVMHDVSEEELFARGTLGLDLRFTQRVALHPSLTYFHGLQTGDVSAAVFGCGVRFGGPTYEGLSF
jgi:hypothetical protein